MIIVLASRYDTASRNLVNSWGDDAQLLTCADLSLRGWRYWPGSHHSAAVIGQRVVDSGKIEGVLTRLPCVGEEELWQIVPEDRSYVAAEMTAFLAAWLSGLKCRVLNRPTPSCLMGPYWRQERWLLAASKLGIPINALHRSASALQDALSDDRKYRPTTVNVVGNQCVGSADKSLYKAARSLAKAAGVELLSAKFASPQAGSEFLGADYWLDVTNPEASDGILQYFKG
jgi:hypothetical protein